jgi:O-acetyl-ADP-ribose deacetylase (regulator of RNase III)
VDTICHKRSNDHTNDDAEYSSDAKRARTDNANSNANAISSDSSKDHFNYPQDIYKIDEIKNALVSSTFKHQKSIDTSSTTTIPISTLAPNLSTSASQTQLQSQPADQPQFQPNILEINSQLFFEFTTNNVYEYAIELAEPKNRFIYSYTRDNPQITIECGSIFDVETVDAIVNSIDTNFSFNGSFARTLLERCGRETVSQTGAYNVPLSFNHSNKTYEIRVTSAGKLDKAKCILNVCFRPFEFVTNEPEIHFKNTILNLLKYCIDNCIRSVALPPLGTGLLGYPASFVVKWLHECFQSFFLSYTCHSMQKIIIVLPSDTPQSNIFTQFYNELDNIKPSFESNILKFYFNKNFFFLFKHLFFRF